MAVNVSKIPNNNKFDPVREAILDLQGQIEDTGTAVGNGTLTINTSGALTGSGTFTANQSGSNTITIGFDASGYLTEEVNDLTAAVTWANVPNAYITQSSVTQHQAALSITESQISDLQSYMLTSSLDDYLYLPETANQTMAGGLTVTGNLLGSRIGIGGITPLTHLHVFEEFTMASITSPIVSRAPFRIQQLTSNMYFDGSSIVITNNGYLSTNGAYDFVIGTNNTPRIHVDSGGNIGIGTSTPLDLLNVNKENAESRIVISRGGTNLGVSTSIGKLDFFANYNGTPIPYANINAYSNALSGVRSSLDFNVKGSPSGNIITGLTVYGTNGGANVGIGTNSPADRLHVVGNGLFKSPSNGSTTLTIEQGGSIGSAVLRLNSGFGSSIIDSNSPLNVNVSGSFAIGIDSLQNVGIGTDAPSYKLHVVGNIGASGNISTSADVSADDVIANRIVDQADDSNYIEFFFDSVRIYNQGVLRFDTANDYLTSSSIALGTDTTGNYMIDVLAGGGMSVSHTQGEGSIATFSHADTSSAANLTASGRTYVTGLTFDTYGHVTSYSTGTETVVDTNTTYSAGGGLTLSGTTFSHTDTSSQASVNNSNGTVIQDVTLDTYGHITGLASVDLDGRYYTESEVNTFINRSYISKHSAADLPVGWYTIATNAGDRAVARFAIWDVNGGDHQSVIFYAAHHFGADSSNTITVIDNSYYVGNPFRHIRIKDGGTYDGAALQVYIDDSTNSVNAAIVGDNVQTNGWVLKDWVPDATDPQDLTNYASFGVRSQVDLDQIAQGGFTTTGPIYADGDTTQYRVFNDNYHPNADTLTTARNINGALFSGGADITTTYWGAARTITIGNTGKSVNGSAAVSWTLAEIGALSLTGGTITGALTVSGKTTLRQLQIDRNQTNAAIWFQEGNLDTNHVLWNDHYSGPTTKGAAGSGFDGIKWNTYRGIHLRGGTGGAYNIIVAENSSGNLNDHYVRLYASNVERLRTTTSGVTITGTATATAFAGPLTGNVTGNLTGTVLTAAQTNITSVGTLSSLAVSGNLTVDTNTLFVDAANNRVGVGTSSPAAKLESYIVNTGAIGASNSANIALGSNGAVDTRSIMTFGKQISGGYAPAFLGFITTDGTGNSKGDIIFGARSVTTDSAPTERMRITSSGNVGIGTTSPLSNLHIKTLVQTAIPTAGTGAVKGLYVSNDIDTYGMMIGSISNGNGYIQQQRTNTATYYNLLLQPNGGKVGIGESTPLVPLHISKNTASGENIALILGNKDTTVNSEVGLLFRSNAGSTLTDFQNTDFQIATINTAANQAQLVFRSDGGTERMRITSSGNVGIGSSSPVSKLTLEGAKNTNTLTLRSTTSDSSWASGDKFGSIEFYSNDNSGGAGAGVKGSIAYINDTGTSGATTAMTFSTAGTISGTNNAERMRIDSSGNVGIGTTTPNGKFTTVGTYATVTHSLAANDAISISSMGVNSSNFNAFTIGQANSQNNSAVMRFKYNGAGSTSNYAGFGFYANDDILNIRADGKVGIGTTSPSEKLEVAGNAILDATNANLKIKAGATGTKGDIQWTFDTDSTVYASAGITYDNRNTDGFLIDSGYPITLDAATGYIRFSNNGSERMRIDSSGVVQVRNQTPTIQLYNTDTSLELNQNLGDIDWYQSDPSAEGVGVVAKIRAINAGSIQGAGSLAFYTGQAASLTERMRILSTGSVGIGVTAPVGGLQVAGDIFPSADGTGSIGNSSWTWASGNFTNLQVDSTLTVTSTLNVRAAIDLADADVLRFGSSDDFKMYYDGSANEMEFEMEAACNQIRVHDNGTTRFTLGRSTGDFSASGSVSCRSATITKDDTFGAGIYITFSGSTTTGMLIRNNTYETKSAIDFYYTEAAQPPRGSIVVSSTSVAYNTTSDYRAKENVVPMIGAIDRVSLLNPVRFSFIGDDRVVDGFLAHEAQEVVPEAVTGSKDAVDYEGNPEYQGIDQSKLVPLLTAALQEAIDKIESLEQRILTLENK